MRKYFRYPCYLLIAIGVSFAHAGAYDDFFRAAGNNDGRTVQTLLARGFDPNSVNEAGQPGLIVALRSQSEAVLVALLAHPGLQVDLSNQAGETALMIAAIQGERIWVEELLRRGARVDREGWSPLHYAASGPAVPLVELLLARGAALDARSPNGTTPLMMAARYGSEQSVLLLLQRGADPRLRNQLGLNAADFARQVGRESLAGRLAAVSP